MSDGAEPLLGGRCLCRAVTFAIDAPLVAASHCHCESCRRAHGAAFVSWATLSAESLRITSGADRIVRYTSSPGAHRSFCGTCGSPLFMRYDAEPSLAWAPFASLETPPERTPDWHWSFEEHVAWFPFEDELPRCVGKTSEPAPRGA